MKRVKAACIQQTLVFMQNENCEWSKEVQLEYNRAELGRYKKDLESKHTQYQIIKEEEQLDGAIVIEILKQYGVKIDVRCLSAHRAHNQLVEFIQETNNNGTEVIIAAAGMAAALPGVVASQTVLPVIGVPISGKNLDGMDALLSIVQMPPGIPVATVAIDGAKNAAYLALQILGTKYEEVKNKLVLDRKDMEEKALKANEEIINKY